MTVWAEYYFEATPAWFPDPRDVFTEAVESLGGGRERIGRGGGSALVLTRTSGEGSGRQPTTTTATTRRNRLKVKDPWCATLFDPEYIQQLVFPGFAAQQQGQQQHQVNGSSVHAALQASPLLADSSSSPSSSPGARVVIPPALALLKGPEMHAYYTLVQYLRTKRRAQVQAAFEAWHAWAAKRVAAKQARDAGWGLVGKEDDDDDEDILRKPRLVVAAKKGVQVEMDRIIQAGPFFGSGPVEFEEETEEEEQEQEEEEEEDGGPGDNDEDMCDIGVVSDEVDGFDDFGFPVGSP